MTKKEIEYFHEWIEKEGYVYDGDIKNVPTYIKIVQYSTNENELLKKYK